MKTNFLTVLMISFLLVSCSFSENMPTELQTATEKVEKTYTQVLPLPTATVKMIETEPVPTKTITATNTEITQNMDNSESKRSAITIDHNSLLLFDQIPDNVIAEAASYRILFRHASVGENIRFGLECMWGNYSQRRPNACGDLHDLRYDSSNWIFQFRGNPGWIEKVDDFIREADSQANDFDVLMFTLGYLDGFDGMSYPEISAEDNFRSMYIEPLESLENRHPDKIFVWWTMSLSQEGHENTQKFNNLLREYSAQENKILMDIADIEAHDPGGNVCLDENQIPVICSDYTDEVVSGHLNKAGREMMAKAFWVLMANITGWSK